MTYFGFLQSRITFGCYYIYLAFAFFAVNVWWCYLIGALYVVLGCLHIVLGRKGADNKSKVAPNAVVATPAAESDFGQETTKAWGAV